MKVTAKKGQPLVFRHADPSLPHGIVFTTPDLVMLQGDDPARKPNAVLKQTDNLGLYAQRVDPGPTPKEMARFEVIKYNTTPAYYMCWLLLTRRMLILSQAPGSGSARALSEI